MGLTKENSFYQRTLGRISETYNGQTIPRRTKWTYSISGGFRDASYALISTLLLIFINESGCCIGVHGDYGTMFAVISGLLIGFRIFDGINDPIMGVFIEKVHFKTGKFKPWIFLGGFVSAISYIALFCGPIAFSWCCDWVYVAWFAIFYLLWDVGFTMNDIAYWSMLPSMSSKEKERAQVTSIVLVACNIGELAVTATFPYLNTLIGVKQSGLIYCLVITGLFLVSQTAVFLLCKERSRKILDNNSEEPAKFRDLFRVLKNNSQARTMIFVVLFYFISTMITNGLLSNLFYVTIGYTTGKEVESIYTMATAIAVLIPPIFMPRLIKKFSLLKVFNVSLILMVASRLIFLFFNMPFGSWRSAPVPLINGNLNAWFVVCSCLVGVIMVLTQTAVYNTILIMMSNTIEYNDYKFGKREDAVIFSLRPFSTKMASSLKQAVQLAALNVTGLVGVMDEINRINREVPKEEQEAAIAKVLETVTAVQIWGLKLFMIVIPLVFLALTMFLVKKYYIIDEKYYNHMCSEIEKRNKKILKIKKAK